MKISEILTTQAMEEIFKKLKKGYAEKNIQQELTFKEFCIGFENYPAELKLGLIKLIIE